MIYTSEKKTRIGHHPQDTTAAHSKHRGRSCSFPVTTTTSADDAPPVRAEEKPKARERKDGEGDVEAHGARRSQKIELLSLSETLLEVSRKCHSSVAPHECFPHYVCRTPETQCLGERRPKGAALERMWSTCWGVKVSSS